MKTDREFLDGIYEKAAVMETALPIRRADKSKSFFTSSGFKAIAVAAAFVLVATPAIYLFNGGENKMIIPEGYSLVERKSNNINHGKNLVNDVPQTGSLPAVQNQARMPMMASGSTSPIEAAELVCAAKVIKIDKSVYDKEQGYISTTVVLKPITIYKNVTANDVEVGQKLSIKVDGGFDSKTKLYQDYEAVFEKGEEVLILAMPTYDDLGTYILSGGGEGKYNEDLQNENAEEEIYINSLGNTVSKSELDWYVENKVK